MINLFRFLLRNSSFFLFIVFEIIALYLVVNYNQSQRKTFLDASSNITATILEKNDQLHDYFNLQEINRNLNQENAFLLEKIISQSALTSTADKPSFKFYNAKVISNQIDGRYNRYVINQGRGAHVKPGMGILSGTFPAGIIYQATENYASVISLLNINLNISARIKNKGYFGLMRWRPPNPQQSVLFDVPAYADVLPGDTVVTSGHSHVFPAQMPLGIVSSVVTPKGSNSHEIAVNLFVNLGRLEYVQVIENVHRTELDSLKRNDER